MTLICNADAPTLTQEKLDAIAAISKGFCNGTLEQTILSSGNAAEYAFPAGIGDLPAFEAAIAKKAATIDVDIAIQPDNHRRKKLLIADMDSTIINEECIDELAAEIGKYDEIAAITERAMRGELDFEAALETRVASLKGLEIGALQKAFENRITLTPGAAALVQTMKAHGATTALISGGFTFFTERVATLTGFQHHRANVLQFDNEQLTGEVQKPILGRAEKEAALIEFENQLDIGVNETLAVGDGANDLAMINRSGLGVAFCAKPAVAAAADVGITKRDLKALLYLQGYSDTDIIES